MAYTRVQAGDDVTPEQINDVYDSMEKLEAISAEVTETLPAGSPATAQVVTDGSGNKKLELKIPQGAIGATGNGISSVELASTVGNIDTYTVTFTSGTTMTFQVTNGKSLEWKGEWDTDTNYVNTTLKSDIIRKEGNVYICKLNNQGAPPPNAIYWDLFTPKGQDGAGSGNLKGTNVSALTIGKTYAIQATTIPSEDGTLEGILVEVASVTDVERKLEKNFGGFYDEKTSIADDDLIAIQDSADGSTPKANKRVKLGLIKGFDLIIRTQAQFNTMIASPNWLGAVSVALIGQFTLSTTDNSGIEIPEAVKQIQGFNSAKITITNFKYNATTAKGGLWYDTAPTTSDYSIRDLEVDCTGIGTSTSTSTGCGFRNCINLTNCTGTGTGAGTGGDYGYGFINCTNLTNCTGTGTSTGTEHGYGFINCDNLVNCTGTGTGTERGYGFYSCTNLINCTGTGAGTGTGTVGYGFYDITTASNCKNGGPSTNMWGGTNKGIDEATCKKTPATANNTTLNT